MVDVPRLSPIETRILDLLVEHGELYGLELIAASGGRLKRGTIYVMLDRMEDKGFIESNLVAGQGRGPARRVYKLTGHGARVRDAWASVGAMFAGVLP